MQVITVTRPSWYEVWPVWALGMQQHVCEWAVRSSWLGLHTLGGQWRAGYPREGGVSARSSSPPLRCGPCEMQRINVGSHEEQRLALLRRVLNRERGALLARINRERGGTATASTPSQQCEVPLS